MRTSFYVRRGVVFAAMMVSVSVLVVVAMASRWSRVCWAPAEEQAVCCARRGLHSASIGRTVGQDMNKKILRAFPDFCLVLFVIVDSK